MTDIVERLRADGAMPAGFGPRAIQREAADEIERLRAECQRLAAEVSRAHKDARAWMEKAAAARREGIDAVGECNKDRNRLREALRSIANNTGCVEACPCWAKLRRKAERALLEDGR